MSWLADAETLCSEAEGIGGAAAFVVAQAWSARVEVAATRGLIGAALSLGADRMDFYRITDPLRSEAGMRAAAGTLAADAWELWQDAKRMRDQAIAARDAAIKAARDADRAERDKGTTAETRTARATAIREAADADAAAQIADEMSRRLAAAHGRLDGVPDDIDNAYEPVHDHLRRGREVPHSGDFLTAPTREGATP